MSDLDPATVMAAHESHQVFYKDSGCVLKPGSYSDGALTHCETYRLAKALQAAEERQAEAVRLAQEIQHWSTCTGYNDIIATLTRKDPA